jgi:hypothetical protein
MHDLPRYLNLALADVDLPQAKPRPLRLYRFPVGHLLLPTGRLAACDPLSYSAEANVFDSEFPSGHHPVVLSVADFGDDQRVAFATITFGHGAVTYWDHLGWEGEDASSLQPGEVFGYGVDSGTGAFFDASGRRLLQQLKTADDTFSDSIGAALEKTYQSTWSWASIPLGTANLLCFSTGWGDGFYPSYCGYDEHGQMITIVSDLAAFDLPHEGPDPSAA